MKKEKIIALLTTITIACGAGACARQAAPVAGTNRMTTQAVKTESHDGHDHAAPNAGGAKKPVPAFQTAESAKNLKPTLSPALFKGTVSAAYAAVKEIPETIAQLPCYCRCDRSAGHKSLHSCFEDGHAANCGICMNSALKAYKLQKEQKLTPEQIRENLNAEYAAY